MVLKVESSVTPSIKGFEDKNKLHKQYTVEQNLKCYMNSEQSVTCTKRKQQKRSSVSLTTSS